MAERVRVIPRGSTRGPVWMDARVAKELVARGNFTYADKQMTAEPEPAAKKKSAKKRVYKRRDLKAED